MPETIHALQDSYLNDLRKEKTRVGIYLVNGIKLVGQIESFDTYVIMLKHGGVQLVYKHAISTIIPMTDAAPPQRSAQTRDTAVA